MELEQYSFNTATFSNDGASEPMLLRHKRCGEACVRHNTKLLFYVNSF